MDSTMESHFRLLDLPRELRDNIYSHLVVCGRILTSWNQEKQMCEFYDSRDATGAYCDPPWLTIFQSNHQVYSEAMAVFYCQNVFDFRDIPLLGHAPYNTSILAFLRDGLPANALGNLRRVGLQIEHNLFHESLGGKPPEWIDLDALIEFLTAHCNLTHLELAINTDCWDTGTLESLQHGNLTDNHDGPWPTSLLRIKDLVGLKVFWRYVRADRSSVHRMMHIAKLLRNNMLRNGNLMGSELTGIRVLSHHCYPRMVPMYPTRLQTRRLILHMHIEDGKSLLPPSTRRVKVLPTRRCEDCGHFDTTSTYQQSCICGASHEAIIDTKLGKTLPYWDRVRLLWDSKALEECLPEGVTEKDFRTAEKYLEDGFDIQLNKYGRPAGVVLPSLIDHADSDFGDTDSLLSLEDTDVEG